MFDFMFAYSRISPLTWFPLRRDRPSDAETWLLRHDNPALPHVMQAVRPLVLPKLREENERANGRGRGKAKKKGVKDVVVQGESWNMFRARIWSPLILFNADFPNRRL
jgi:hypothetical protein